MGNHNISVIYTGGPYHLSWDFITVQNGSLADMQTKHQSFPVNKSNKKMTILLSSVIPAALVTICFLIGFFIFRRRQKKKLLTEPLDVDTSMSPSILELEIMTPDPFTSSRPPILQGYKGGSNGSRSHREQNNEELSVVQDSTGYRVHELPSYEP